MQRIEGVEKLLLGALLVDQELDVVHQQDIHGAVLVAEAGHLAVAQRVDHVIGETFTGHVTDRLLRLPLLDLVANRLHEVGFAHPHPTIEKQGVIGLGGTLGHRPGRSMGKLVARTAHEIVERVLGIELSSAIPIEALLVRGTNHGVLHRRGGIVPGFRGVGCLAVATLRLIGYELDILELEAEVVYGFADQIAVSFADMAELRIGHADEQHAALRMVEASGLEPGFVGSAVDFFLQRVKNSHPRICADASKGRHKKLSRGSKKCPTAESMLEGNETEHRATDRRTGQLEIFM